MSKVYQTYFKVVVKLKDGPDHVFDYSGHIHEDRGSAERELRDAMRDPGISCSAVVCMNLKAGDKVPTFYELLGGYHE